MTNMFGRRVREFLKSGAGNVGLLFGISAVPLLVGIGAAIDFQKSTYVEASLQNAADSAALAAATSSGNIGQKQAKADRIFLSNFEPRAQASLTSKGLKIVNLPNNKGQKFIYEATAVVPTSLMALVGIKTVKVNVTAVSQLSPGSLEVALVLDNTGSMQQQGRMVSLKRAATDLVDKLDNGRTKFSLVPFDTQVNLDNVTGLSGGVGTAPNPYDAAVPCSSIADALDRAACNSATRETGVPKAGYVSSTSNTTVTGLPLLQTTTKTDVYTYPDGSQVRITTVSEPLKADTVTTQLSIDGGATWQAAQIPSSTKPNKTITANNDLLLPSGAPWSGCVIDRQQPNDVSNSSPVNGNSATIYPKANCAVSTLAKILPLTTSGATVRARIAAMAPSGNTNVTIGVQWGVESLTPTAPLSTGAAFSTPALEKHMIVVTDGLNTQNRWATDATAIDARAAQMCASAKALGIVIHTVRLQQGNAALLRACASKPEFFHDVAQANALDDAFDEILKQISRVTLSE